MLQILQGLQLEKERQPEEPVRDRLPSNEEGEFAETGDATTSSAELHSAEATIHAVTFDDLYNNDHMPGPSLVLPGYNLTHEELRTSDTGHGSPVHSTNFNTVQPENVYPGHK
jgi:hypothetical protein